MQLWFMAFLIGDISATGLLSSTTVARFALAVRPFIFPIFEARASNVASSALLKDSLLLLGLILFFSDFFLLLAVFGLSHESLIIEVRVVPSWLALITL